MLQDAPPDPAATNPAAGSSRLHRNHTKFRVFITQDSFSSAILHLQSCQKYSRQLRHRRHHDALHARYARVPCLMHRRDLDGLLISRDLLKEMSEASRHTLCRIVCHQRSEEHGVNVKIEPGECATHPASTQDTTFAMLVPIQCGIRDRKRTSRVERVFSKSMPPQRSMAGCFGAKASPASHALFSAISSRSPSSCRSHPKSLAQHASAAASALPLAPCNATH